MRIVAILLFLTIGCSHAPQKIEYGVEVCNFCQMTIVSKTHAAQLVTKKGKQLKFDAIECMLHYFRDSDNEVNTAIMLVANYKQPGEMINALNATYLISPNIQSPMGANLSAFNSEEEAATVRNQHDGDIYTWEHLKAKMNVASHPNHTH